MVFEGRIWYNNWQEYQYYIIFFIARREAKLSYTIMNNIDLNGAISLFELS